MRSLKRIVALLPWCSSVCLSVRPSVCLLSVCPSGTGVHCDHMMRFSLWLESPMFWAHWHHPHILSRLFSSSTWKRGRAWMYSTGRNQGHGTVLWFRYAFLKQYCESKGHGSGRGLVSRRRAHGWRCVWAWLLRPGVRQYIIWLSTWWILMVFSGVFLVRWSETLLNSTIICIARYLCVNWDSFVKYGAYLVLVAMT